MYIYRAVLDAITELLSGETRRAEAQASAAAVSEAAKADEVRACAATICLSLLVLLPLGCF